LLQRILYAALFCALLPGGGHGAGRPADMKRAVSLDGEWTLTLDPAGTGKDERWGERTPPLPGKAVSVRVPSAWERWLPDYHGSAWYETAFECPRRLGTRLVITVGASNYRSECWVNGKYVGAHEGGYTPFSFDVTGAVVPGGSNRLVMLVEHPSASGTPQSGPGMERLPLSKETWYYPYAGIRGSVILEGRSDPWIEDLTVVPNAKLDGVAVRALIAGNGQPFRDSIVFSIGERYERAKVSLPAGPPEASRAVIERELRLDEVKHWTPEKPVLYLLAADLHSAEGPLETRTATFGMRSVDFREGVFRLNGIPRQIRGVLLQPDRPAGLADAPGDSRGGGDLELAKSLGFNLVRAHLKPLTDSQLDWCDAHGLMVYEETPVAWMDEPDPDKSFQVAARETKEMILAHRNHPCVVVWGVSNENGKFSGETGAQLLRLAGQLDPSRPAIDVSGWAMNIFPEGGWRHETQVANPGSSTPGFLEDDHHYLRSPAGDFEWNLFRNLGDPARMGSYERMGYGPAGEEKAWHERLSSRQDGIFVSEFGCGGVPDFGVVARGYDELRASEKAPASATGLQDERDYAGIRDGLERGLEKRGLARSFGGVTGFVEACQLQQALGVRRQSEALRLNPRVSGWVLTQLNDASWECSAGLVDPWRNPKRAAGEIPRLTAPFLLAVRPATQAVEAGDRAQFTLTLASDVPPPRNAVAEYRTRSNDSLPSPWKEIRLRDGSATVFVADLPLKGTLAFEARFRQGRKTLSSAEESVFVGSWLHNSQVSFTLLGEAPALWRVFGGWLIPREDSAILVAARPAALQRKELEQALATAKRGGRVVFLDLAPEDLAALQKLAGFPLKGGLRKSISTFMGWFHWFRRITPMGGLPGIGDREPGRWMAGEPLANLLPIWSLPEPSGSATIYAGAAGMNIRIMEPDGPAWHWCADIMAVAYGKGKLVFCQYRLLEALESNPAAQSLFCRLLKL